MNLKFAIYFCKMAAVGVTKANSNINPQVFLDGTFFSSTILSFG